jgi:hypothetical protein
MVLNVAVMMPASRCMNCDDVQGEKPTHKLIIMSRGEFAWDSSRALKKVGD